MKNIFYFITLIFLFIGCSQKPIVDKKEIPQKLSTSMPNTYLIKSDFSQLPKWNNENYIQALNSFINSCRTKKTKKLYNSLCKKATQVKDAKVFLENEFQPYKIFTKNSKDIGLLTGYYEAELHGSLKKHKQYIYPIYTTPSDLITVDLSSIYPQLKKLRLRGKLKGNKLIPYADREHSNGDKSDILCYVNSKIDLFFLEIQGSGRVTLDNGKTLFIGYANQNGHKYSAIGRYLVKQNAIKLEDVSLQSIRSWLEKHPSRVDEVLNYNRSVVYFRKKEQMATGSLGLELTPKRSVAVDRHYIPLGMMLYLNADIDNKNIAKIVIAQDTGGAIKGAIRADMFLGFGDKAMNIAGKLKSPLKLWAILPKKENKR